MPQKRFRSAKQWNRHHAEKRYVPTHKEAEMKHRCWICGCEATKGFEVYDRNEIEGKRYKSHFFVDDTPYFTLRTLVSPSDGQRVYCDSCFNAVWAERRAALDEFRRTRTWLMVEKAIRMLEQQGTDVYEFQKAITTVSVYATEYPEKFNSSHEVLAAIILTHNKVKARPQYPVGEYRVDFCLPELKVMLEIDGGWHRHKNREDAVRDASILSKLPIGWDVVRIPTDCLEQKAVRLLAAIDAVLERRQREMDAIVRRRKPQVSNHVNQRDATTSADRRRGQ
jgi:very-short-patch-repair endonuclease